MRFLNPPRKDAQLFNLHLMDEWGMDSEASTNKIQALHVAQQQQQQQTSGSASEQQEGKESSMMIKVNAKVLENGNTTEVKDVELSKDELVTVLKEKISEKLGIEEKKLRVIYKGQVLKDNKTLEESNITDGVTIHAVVKEVSQTGRSTSPPSARSGTRSPLNVPGDRNCNHVLDLCPLNVGDSPRTCIACGSRLEETMWKCNRCSGMVCLRCSPEGESHGPNTFTPDSIDRNLSQLFDQVFAGGSFGPSIRGVYVGTLNNNGSQNRRRTNNGMEPQTLRPRPPRSYSNPDILNMAMNDMTRQIYEMQQQALNVPHYYQLRQQGATGRMPSYSTNLMRLGTILNSIQPELQHLALTPHNLDERGFDRLRHQMINLLTGLGEICNHTANSLAQSPENNRSVHNDTAQINTNPARRMTQTNSSSAPAPAPAGPVQRSTENGPQMQSEPRAQTQSHPQANDNNNDDQKGKVNEPKNEEKPSNSEPPRRSRVDSDTSVDSDGTGTISFRPGELEELQKAFLVTMGLGEEDESSNNDQGKTNTLRWAHGHLHLPDGTCLPPAPGPNYSYCTECNAWHSDEEEGGESDDDQ